MTQISIDIRKADNQRFKNDLLSSLYYMIESMLSLSLLFLLNGKNSLLLACFLNVGRFRFSCLISIERF